MSTEAQTQSPPVAKTIASKYTTRTAEAKALVTKAKNSMGESGNLRKDIKTDVTTALNRLFELVKEGESKKKGPEILVQEVTTEEKETEKKLKEVIIEHTRSIQEHTQKMRDLEKALEEQKKENLERVTPLSYAEAVASYGTDTSRTPGKRTVHSIIVTSKEDTETGDEVLTRVRKAVDAKEGWVKVERVRKAKDRKVILGFGTREERQKARDKLERNDTQLLVEEVKNKDPLLILKNVLSIHTDDEVIKAVRNQNGEVFRGLEQGEDRVEIKYRRKTRNPHTCHIVIGVSPTVWGKTLKTGSLHVDLQRIRVEDQSPLVQCTRCLGFGHGKRFCREEVDLCSHCGGPHLSKDCADRLAKGTPCCRNCAKAQLESTFHNAFYSECPIRKKWDRLARSAVAYC
ncbi:unnamed protein product [Arctia plantaginis]|uniref:Gag-like protein n=1 Tax=Arctia plantaginis TaxID=874455 RepID=A0A8S0ZX41_ARCPL|nr:unnamed protein product [Arctia plantaginis]